MNRWVGRSSAEAERSSTGGHRRLRRFAAGIAVFAAVMLCGAQAPAVAGPAIPLNTIAPTDTIPNYFYDHGMTDVHSIYTNAFADAQSGLLFEYNQYASCATDGLPQLVALDVDTYKVVATSKRQTSTGCTDSTTLHLTGAAPIAAVDPKDGLIIGSAGPAGIYGRGGYVGLVDERTLDERYQLQLPSTSPPSIVGVSWYSANNADQIIVETSFGNTSHQQATPGGVQLYAYDIPSALKALAAQQTPQPLWGAMVQSCQFSLATSYGQGAAYHASNERAVYLPCQLQSFSGPLANGNQKDGVVKVELGTSGCTAPATECPDGTTSEAIGPGAITDALFDPGSDRLFMPVQTPSGTSVLVYDGRTAIFGDRASVGTPDDTDEVAVGLDTMTGRLYAVARTAGMTVIDGRRTPLAPGSQFRQYADGELLNIFPVLPPDTAHPYTRVAVNNDEGIQPKAPNSGVQKTFTVYADTLPVTEDPPVTSVDTNTYHGDIPPGSSVSSVYGASARGYGFHSDFVRGPNGVMTNLPVPQLVTKGQIPFGSSAPDLMGGVVQQLHVTGGSSQASADALQDVEGSTSYAFGQCSDVQQASSCSQVVPAGAGSSAGPSSQQWPYPAAACDEPGNSAAPQSSKVGVYYTTHSKDASGADVATQQMVPNSDASAKANVNCISNSPAGGSALGSAFLSSVSTPSSAGAPWFSLGDAASTACVIPPGTASIVSAPSCPVVTKTATHGTIGWVRSSAQGIHIDLGQGSAVDIGSVTHTAWVTAAGVAGSASATDQVVLKNVDVVVNGQSHAVCAGVCTGDPQAVIATINGQFSSQLQLFLPQADTRYYPSGSPGGYIAAVQADPVEQDGDQRFNEMSPEESSFLPGLRVVMYGYGDGDPNISREVLDLAGVAADAETGLQVFPPPAEFGGGPQPAINPDAAALAAGVRSDTINPSSSAGASSNGGPAVGLTSAQGLLGVAEQFWRGLNWLARSPWGAVQMAAFLLLLGLPTLIIRRRWTWMENTEGES